MSPGRAQSNEVLKRWCPEITGHVLSIGSSTDSDGNGKKYREYFTNAKSYTTSEVGPHPDCDLVLDVRHMPEIPSRHYHAVFCSGVLEHVDDCHSAVAECWRVLEVDGWFLVGVPFNQPIHRAPQDFWRFTEHGVDWMLRAFAIDAVEKIGDPDHPSAYWVKARKVMH